MALWSIQPDCPDGIRAICLKTLVEREPSKVELMRLADGGDRMPVIQIQIAPWAGGPGTRKAIEMRPVIEGEAVDFETIARQTNSGPSAPELSDEGRLRAAARASAVTQVLEVPVVPDQPRRVVAQVSAARGRVDMRGELLKKFGGVSFERAAEPDRNVVTEDKIFER
jgi:hypothetical protein